MKVPRSIVFWLSWLYAQAVQRVSRELRSVFDSDFYVSKYPDVATSHLHPLAHFLLFGARENRQPNAFFDVAFYRRTNPHLSRGVNPLLHYLRQGWKDDRRPNEWLDPPFYRVANFLGSDVSPLRHYVESIRNGQHATVIPDPAEFLPSGEAAPSSPLNARSVDVIVDARGEPEDIRECIDSIHASHVRTPFEIRAGLEPRLERDVVLLSSHARVAGNWLDRLVHAAYSDERIGTVTPFTNAVGIFSHSVANAINPPPHDFVQIDSAAQEANTGRRIDMPRMGAHCAFIKRECFTGADSSDLNNLETFSRQVHRNGFRHLLAADVFVGMQAASQSETTRDRLSQTDPAFTRRVALTAAHIRRSGKSVILNISHGMGGGVEEAMRRKQEEDPAVVMLTLEPATGGMLRLSDVHPGSFSIWASLPSHHESLLLLLQSFGVSRVHIQHLMGHTDATRQLVQDLRVPVDFTVHDYHVVCPRITLTRIEGSYCGEPEEAVCNDCIAASPCEARDIKSWRDEHSWAVQDASRVVAPSNDTAHRLRRYFPDRVIEVVPHESSAAAMPAVMAPIGRDESLRIAVLGAMAAHKGLHTLRACAAITKERQLPLTFTLIGAADGTFREPFRQTGRYAPEDLPELIKSVAPHLIWFPGQAPETYSFTLSSALFHRLPVAARDIGAVPERLQGRDWTWILPVTTTPEQWIQFFLTIRTTHFIPGVSPYARSNQVQSVPTSQTQASSTDRDG